MTNPNNSSDTAKNIIHVAVAVIRDEHGQVLVSRRLKHVHQGGLWEFPGGKRELGESVFQALQRELMEELALTIIAARPLITITHAYDDCNVLLDVWAVTSYSGVAISCEGQQFKWLSPQSLFSLDMPAADVPIVQAVNLPDVYLITAEPEYLVSACCLSDTTENDQHKKKSISRFVTEFTHSVQSSSVVQLRLKNIPIDSWTKIAKECLQIAKHNNCQLIVNASIEQAISIGVTGVHLDGNQLQYLSHDLSQTGKSLSNTIQELIVAKDSPAHLTQSSASSGMMVSASCHNSQQLRMAEDLGVDFIVLSPVLKTASHPAAKGMGWEKFEILTRECNVPVFALGGLSAKDILVAQENGGQGVAGISAFWKSV
ncbi:Mutator mutT protein (7,8-dihydro-8-oxoguanine-triphosphatase) / Thiamin-phosphate pyrophosphorylase-like protein [hydrothermal vent metagenome]|uniref:8-oxo-dGTP diphosphatase n=1 Tax=hydrothermal vent metagenome TaxID=652676 RepID=A0A3B0YDR6_9ZZZZ